MVVETGLEASLVNKSFNQVRLEYGKSSLKVLKNLASVKFDLNNSTCTNSNFNYLVNKRSVIIGAMKADSITVITESALDKRVEAALDLILKNAGAEFQLQFSSAKEINNEFNYTARDVFYAAYTSSLVVKECGVRDTRKKIKHDELYSFDLECDFTVRLKRGELTDDFSVEIFMPADIAGGSGTINVEVDKPTSIPISDNTRANVTISQASKENVFKIDVILYMVAINASESI